MKQPKEIESTGPLKEMATGILLGMTCGAGIVILIWLTWYLAQIKIID